MEGSRQGAQCHQGSCPLLLSEPCPPLSSTSVAGIHMLPSLFLPLSGAAEPGGPTQLWSGRGPWHPQMGAWAVFLPAGSDVAMTPAPGWVNTGELSALRCLSLGGSVLDGCADPSPSLQRPGHLPVSFLQREKITSKTIEAEQGVASELLYNFSPQANCCKMSENLTFFP